MTEVIEKRREQSIREYECMKHLKLFTDDEIREIKNKRFRHEHKVERRTKELVDFINYIVYESNLLQLLTERRKKLHITQERYALDKSILIRIKGLYKRALDRFPSEYRLWAYYMKHCLRHDAIAEGSRTLDAMINHHGDKPKAWINAANWEYEHAGSMIRAKHFMYRGLQRHPECYELYITFIGIQLTEARKLIDESDESMEDLLKQENSELNKTLESAMLLFDYKKEKDLEFIRELLKLLEEHRPLGVNMAVKAIAEMKERHAEKEEMWNVLANLALDGCVQLYESEQEAVPFKNRLEKCVNIYQEALERLNTSQMYSFYIDTMLKVNEDMSTEQKRRRKALAAAFKGAFEADLLEEAKLVQYLKLLISVDVPREETIRALIEKGLNQCPQSVEFWALYLRFLIRTESTPSTVEQTFAKALKTVTGSVLPLWKMLIQYYHMQPEEDSKMLEKTFRKAIKQVPEVSMHFQPIFLDYLMLTKSIDSVRQEYRAIVQECPTDLAVHHKMADLESIQTEPNVSHWRTCHENATQVYGATSPAAWIEYIKFERNHGKPRNMPPVYERAKVTLADHLIADFIDEYEKLKNPLF